jgi:hypothetical protein
MMKDEKLREMKE